MHITKLPSGSWRAQGSVNGRRYSLTRESKAKARHAAAQQEVSLGSMPSVGRHRLKMADALEGHLADAEGRWSPTTYDDVRRVVDRLPESFTEMTVRDITPSTLVGLYGRLSRDGWSAHRIRRAHMAIGLALADAVIHGHLAHNPAREVHPPKTSAPNVSAPSDADVRAIRAAASGHLIDFLILATATGARRGELVALQWQDVDFVDGTIWIRRSLAQKVGAPPVVRQTKTGSKGHRTLGVGVVAMDMLRRRYDDAVVKVRDDFADRPWIFSHDAGFSPWRPDYVSRLFRKACELAGVTGVRLHDLRHHVATSMLRDGEAPIRVAAQLGHSTVATTLSTYSHYLPAQGGEAADRRLS